LIKMLELSTNKVLQFLSAFFERVNNLNYKMG
jgi:hypothetical protein